MLTQLSAQDASFVNLETPTTPMHTGAVAIYSAVGEVGGAPDEGAIHEYIEQRLHLSPMSRRRLVRVPFNADHPYWIEDSDFDLEYHVRRIGLPRPGTWNELFDVAARIFSRPLDPSRPLWEIYVIDGLDNLAGVPSNSFALLSKTHYAAIDAASGGHLMEVLHHVEPDDAAVPPPTSAWQGDPVPDDAELMWRAFGNNMARANPLLQPWLSGSTSFGTAPFGAAPFGATPFGAPFGAPGGLLSPRVDVPQTRFNAAITQHRVVGAERFDLDEFRALRKSVQGATVNDTVLAVCGGGIRAYLQSIDELPSKSLVALAPININIRSAARARGSDTRISGILVPIGTDIGDPIERLQSISAHTRKDRAINSATSAAALTDYDRFAPSTTEALADRYMSEQSSQRRRPFNCAITNVPGPQTPLYALGARLVTTVGMGPISQGLGLNMPVGSYCGELVVSFTSCREMIEEPEAFSGAIEQSFRDLRKSAGNRRKTRSKPLQVVADSRTDA